MDKSIPFWTELEYLMDPEELSAIQRPLPSRLRVLEGRCEPPRVLPTPESEYQCPVMAHLTVSITDCLHECMVPGIPWQLIWFVWKRQDSSLTEKLPATEYRSANLRMCNSLLKLQETVILLIDGSYGGPWMAGKGRIGWLLSLVNVHPNHKYSQSS